MKFTKRILVALLAAALLVSCMLFAVSAEDTFKGEGINDIEDIMEYYYLDDYLADNYEGGNFSTEYYSGTATVGTDPTDENNSVLTVTKKNDMYSNASETDKLIVSFDIYFGAVNNSEYKLNVMTLDAEGQKLTTTPTTIFSVNAREGAFQYSVWDPTLNGTGGFTLEAFEGIAPTIETWYNVVIFFNAEAGEYNFKISSDDGASWTESGKYSLGDVAKMQSFELRADRTGRSTAVNICLDNVQIYCGTYERKPTDKNNITAQTLLDLDALYNAETTDLTTKVRIAEVLNGLINVYNYTPEPTTPELAAVEAVIDKAPTYICYAFANEYIGRVNKINKQLGYYERLEWLEILDYYNGVLPADDLLATTEGMTEELANGVKAARVLYLAEVEDCAKTAADSEAFIKAMSHYNPDSKDYVYLTDLFMATELCPNHDDTYAEAVEGVTDFTMADAVTAYESFAAKYLKLKAASDKFIDGATDMKEALAAMAQSAAGEAAYEEAFAKLYTGYVAANAVYNGGDIDENLDESTHTELVALFETYTANESSVLAEAARCEEFLNIMEKAKAATYYTAILIHLEDAKLLVDVVRTKYEGVEDAKALYNALAAAISDNNSASAAYIAAVANIATKTTFAEKKKAVEAAIELKEFGDVHGAPGVKEANIALSKAAAEIEALIGNSTSLITLVSQIKEVDNLAMRRLLLASAKNAADNSEASYAGVAEAKAELATLIAEFEAELKAANDAHTNAVVSASDLAGAVAPDAKVYKAASVVKDFAK